MRKPLRHIDAVRANMGCRKDSHFFKLFVHLNGIFEVFHELQRLGVADPRTLLRLLTYLSDHCPVSEDEKLCILRIKAVRLSCMHHAAKIIVLPCRQLAGRTPCLSREAVLLWHTRRV